MTEQIECTFSGELGQFCQIICRHIGLIVPENERATLEQILRERIDALKMNSAQAYFGFLETGQQENDQEWTLLANRLRVGESYFFRDSGQMSLLETTILPELLNRNDAKRSLRILSAGCSTGEEVYSLAILLDRILSIRDVWDIRIIGVDIDESALNNARKGLYTEWSFRRLPKTIKQAYFEQQGNRWQIRPPLSSKIGFIRLNLVKDKLPAEDIQIVDIDLILCRNVLIYFHPNTIENLVDKFAHTLNFGGYLMTGHGELYGINHPLLETRSFATSVTYQKLDKAQELPSLIIKIPPLKEQSSHAHISKKKALQISATSNAHKKKVVKKHPHKNYLPNAVPNTTTCKLPLNSNKDEQSNNDIVELRAMLQQGRYNELVAISTDLLNRSPQDLNYWRLLALAYANLGQHTEAEFCCNKLLEIDTFYAPAYLILARIALEKGEEIQRTSLLKKALYLDHNFVAPMLELAEVYAQEGNAKRAKKLRNAAYKVLHTLPRDSIVDMLEDWTVRELLGQVRNLL